MLEKKRAVNQGQVVKMVFDNFVWSGDALCKAMEIMMTADGTHSVRARVVAA